MSGARPGGLPVSVSRSPWPPEKSPLRPRPDGFQILACDRSRKCCTPGELEGERRAFRRLVESRVGDHDLADEHGRNLAGQDTSPATDQRKGSQPRPTHLMSLLLICNTTDLPVCGMNPKTRACSGTAPCCRSTQNVSRNLLALEGSSSSIMDDSRAVDAGRLVDLGLDCLFPTLDQLGEALS